MVKNLEQTMKKLAFLIILSLGISTLSAQNQQVMFTIDGEAITADEFKSTYLKNNTNASSPEAFDTYLQLFINFKLKVHEAQLHKIDTAADFKKEYQSYVKQLAQAYLTDTEVNNALIDEAYRRMGQEINASHILISVRPEADTVAPYNKALEIRKRLLAGEQFERLARENSNDQSVEQNGGNLGYFTAFQMVYPFETAAYNTPKGQISMPVRTQFGYHLIKVNDIRPSQGKVKIAHIMLRLPPRANQHVADSIETKIKQIHAQLVDGQDFATLAKTYSQDMNTAANGGEYSWLSTGQIIPEIERAAFALTEKGSLSAPFKSTFGWHIVKLLDRKQLGTKDEMLPEIRTRLARDARVLRSINSFVEKRKTEYGFKLYPKHLEKARQLVDSSIYSGQWTVPNNIAPTPLFTLAGNDFNLNRFANFMAQNQRLVRRMSIQNFVNQAFDEWVKREIIQYEESQLARKYPDFRQLQQEYWEGMLLFEITNRAVWAKSTDSATVADFYAQNKNNYVWGQRVHYVIFTLPEAKYQNKFDKLLNNDRTNMRDPAAFAALATKKLKTRVDYKLCVANPDDADIQGFTQWPKGVSTTNDNDGKVLITKILQTTTGEIKNLDDCKGQVTADLQGVLEKQWIDYLNKKFTVKINQELVEKIKTELTKI